jgi:uncharacterized protein YkwD
MHREPGLRPRVTLIYLAPFVVMLVLGVIAGRIFFGSPSGSSDAATLASAPLTKKTATPTAVPTTAATVASIKTPVVATAVTNLGVAKGVFTLKAPGKVAKGSFVVFVMDGKHRVLKTDSTAPYAVKVHTTAIPNGSYTVSVLVTHKGKTSVVSTGTLKVKNAAAKTKTKPAPAPSGNTGYAGQVLSLTNAERAKVGCKALTANSKLTSAAQAHSADMAANNYFDHNSQDGKTPFDRMKDAGYSFSAAAENIAMGQLTPAAVMSAWMNSPGHKANILNCTYTQIGVGYAKDKSGAPYWTQDFGKPL